MSLTPATFGGAAVNGSSGAGKPFRSPTITPALPGIALSCGCRTISTCDSGEGGAADLLARSGACSKSLVSRLQGKARDGKAHYQQIPLRFPLDPWRPFAS